MPTVREERARLESIVQQLQRTIQGDPQNVTAQQSLSGPKLPSIALSKTTGLGGMMTKCLKSEPLVGPRSLRGLPGLRPLGGTGLWVERESWGQGEPRLGQGAVRL